MRYDLRRTGNKDSFFEMNIPNKKENLSLKLELQFGAR